MKRNQPWHGAGEVQDEGFWADVAIAFREYLEEGVRHTSEEELWEASKKRARHRYVVERRIDKAKREGKSYGELLAQEQAERKKRREQELH